MLEAWIVIVILVAVDFGIQWVCFPIAFGLKTEKFFDLAGSITHLVVTWLAFGLFLAVHNRGIVQSVCASVWALRLGIYLVYRAAKHGDNRFVEIRASCPKFFITWSMQAVWVACNLAPTIAMLCAGRNYATLPLEWRDYLGWSLFAVGMTIETVADAQKTVFKARDENRGKFITSGLWSVSRHPNYFGEILLWWSLALSASAAFDVGWYWFTWLGPLINTVLICFVSGIPMLEKSAYQRWGDDPAYQEYIRKTGVLVPFIPCPLCSFCK